MRSLNRPFLGIVLTSALVLAGCGNGSDSASAGSTADVEALQNDLPSESPAPELAPAEEGHRQEDVQAGSSADTCLAANLDITATASGSTYQLEMKNTGADCTMIGFPEVSMVGGGNERQIGAQAKRSNTASNYVTLQRDQTATATLEVAGTATFDSATCNPTPADGFRVFPPANTNSIFVPAANLQGCDNPDISVLTVGPVKGPVK
ncbi:DUF4232 domain-containing protein [Corynebacterium sp. S7]